jgi:hypothetical protein
MDETLCTFRNRFYFSDIIKLCSFLIIHFIGKVSFFGSIYGFSKSLSRALSPCALLFPDSFQLMIFFLMSSRDGRRDLQSRDLLFQRGSSGEILQKEGSLMGRKREGSCFLAKG